MKTQVREPSDQGRRKVGSSLKGLVRRVSQSLHVDMTALKQPSKSRQLLEVRDILSCIVREYTVHQGAELARILRVDPSVISRGATRIAQRVEKEGNLASTIEGLVSQLGRK